MFASDNHSVNQKPSTVADNQHFQFDPIVSHSTTTKKKINRIDPKSSQNSVNVDLNAGADDDSITDRQQTASEVYRQRIDEQNRHHSDIEIARDKLNDELKVWEYRNGVRRNMRSLLSSLHTIL